MSTRVCPVEVRWSKDVTPARAYSIVASAEIYGVSQAGFTAGFNLVYKGSYSDLSKMPIILRFPLRNNPRNTMGYNFTATLNQLHKVTDWDSAFVWMLLAHKYALSLEDVEEVIHLIPPARFEPLLARGCSLPISANLITQDVDNALIDSIGFINS